MIVSVFLSCSYAFLSFLFFFSFSIVACAGSALRASRARAADDDGDCCDARPSFFVCTRLFEGGACCCALLRFRSTCLSPSWVCDECDQDVRERRASLRVCDRSDDGYLNYFLYFFLAKKHRGRVEQEGGQGLDARRPVRWGPGARGASPPVREVLAQGA